MNKKRLAFISLILLALGALVVYLLQGQKPVPLELHRLPIMKNVTIVSTHPGTGELIFSNGRYLVSYNPLTKATKQLSRTEALPPVTEIIVSPQNPELLVFQTLEQIDVKELRDRVLAKNAEFNSGTSEETANPYKIDEPTWWLLNTRTSQIDFIAQSARVEWDRGSIIFVNNSRILSRDTATGQTKELYSGSSIYGFRKDGISLLVDRGTDLYFKNISSGEATNKPADGFVIFNRSDACFLTIESNPKIEEAEAYLNNCPDKRYVGKTHGEEEFIGFADGGGYMFFYREGIIEVWDKKLDRVGYWSVASDYGLLRVDKSLLILEKDGFLYAANMSGVPPKPIEKDQSLKVNEFTVKIETSTQSISIEKEGLMADGDREFVLERLKQLGFNPDLYHILFAPSY